MSQAESSGKMVRTIRLSNDRIREILDELDATDKDRGSADSGRTSLRYSYRVKALVVHMQQPGFSAPVPFLVPGRNISKGGVAFLHGGFVHPQTRCLVQLITSYGTWNNVNGSVMRCQLVEGNIHEVVVIFDHSVDPAVYCADAVRSRVLLVEDDSAIARLAQFHLEQLNSDTDLAENGEEAVEMALAKPYDLVLMDMEMPVLNGFEATKRLRERGYTGAIAAATALTQPDDEEKCLKAGCDKYLPKPFSREALSTLLESLRQEPLFSTFHDDASMASLVREFVIELPGQIRRLEEAVRKEDVDAVVAAVRSIKAGGTSYGFEIITKMADGIEKAVLGRVPLSDVKKDVDVLSKLCFQVRAPQEQSASGAEAPAASISPKSGTDKTGGAPA